MAATTVDFVRLEAAGTSIQDYFTSLYTWLVSNPGNFTLSNAEGAPDISSFTMTHSQGWQFNFRVSSNTILGMISPNGGIVSSSAPGTPFGYSGEAVFIPTPSGTSTRVHIILMPDALTFAVLNSANTFWSYGFHAGKIYVPDNSNDPTDYYIDGLGFMAHLPLIGTFGSGQAWASSNGTACKIRVSETLWYPIVAEVNSTIGGTAPSGIRFSPYTLCANSTSPTSLSTNYGRTKYLRRSNSTQVPFTVIPAVTTTQGWMHYANSASVTNQVIVIDRLVAP